MVGQALKGGGVTPDDHLRIGCRTYNAQSRTLPGAWTGCCKVLARAGIQMGQPRMTLPPTAAQVWRKRGVRVASFPKHWRLAEAAAAGGITRAAVAQLGCAADHINAMLGGAIITMRRRARPWRRLITYPSPHVRRSCWADSGVLSLAQAWHRGLLASRGGCWGWSIAVESATGKRPRSRGVDCANTRVAMDMARAGRVKLILTGDMRAVCQVSSGSAWPFDQCSTWPILPAPV